MKSSQNMGAAAFSIRQITVIGVLTAITVVLGQFGLGFLVIPGLPLKITIMHIPVIIGAIIEGPVVGAIVGLLFGIFSIIQNMMVPTPLSFALLNPLVSVLPRILIGITSYYAYKAIIIKSDVVTVSVANRVFKVIAEAVKTSIAAAVGTATNTIGVLGMIYILYAAPFAELRNVDVSKVGSVIAGIAVTNGIPEVIAAMIISTAVITALKKIVKR
ncbi:ECF transporter S component [Petroclostridium sp. X23]|uniref:ECF transporter S component n=1 Tax=Petroclostridium sp. X23 TaxID=3045146 RepID=UPI0024ACF01D|nr:ECF transporter S component [Petroclostridium sp. X23]WHH60527.1 ECF transporter S component [Petroclostridium sp. X23]